MDFNALAQTLGREAVRQITEDIYQQIIWEYIIYSIKAGIIAGLIITAIGIILGHFKFSSLDLTTYMGCMLTGTNKGKAPFVAGFLVHIFASAAFGVIYLYLIHTFKIPGTPIYAFAIGIAHTFFSGACMLIFDAINPCTRNNTIPYVGFMGTAQGMNAMIAYAFSHILYAIIVVMLLTR